MAKKNNTTQYAPSMQKDNNVTISINKIITTVIGAILIGAIFGIFSTARLADSTYIKATTNAESIRFIQDDMVSQSQWQQTEKRLDRIEIKLDKLLSLK